MTPAATSRLHQADSDFPDQRPAAAGTEPEQDTTPAESPMRLDRYEREMLWFYVRWAPYGGPPEAEVFPEFGLSLVQLLVRVQQVIASMTNYALSSEDLRLVHRPRCVALRRGGTGTTVSAFDRAVPALRFRDHSGAQDHWRKHSG